MPKFLDGYSTTLGSRVNTDKLKIALNESIVKDNQLASSLDLKKIYSVHPVFITALQDSEEKIGLFAHPFYFTTHKGEKVLATDMRLYLRKKIYNGYLSSLPAAVSNKVDFDFAHSRAALNLEWIEGDVESLKTELWFSTAMFARWISDVMTKAYALNPGDQIIIGIVASYYYQALFTDETNRDDDTLQKWIIHTSKATNYSDKPFIEEIFRKMPPITGFQSLIDGIRIATDNVRLDNNNMLTMLTLLKNSWYGTNAVEIIKVAIEHPPTWMAMVNAALSERSFRQSQIYKISERVGKRGVSEEYTRHYNSVVGRYYINEAHQELVNAGLA